MILLIWLHISALAAVRIYPPKKVDRIWGETADEMPRSQRIRVNYCSDAKLEYCWRDVVAEFDVDISLTC